MESYFPSKKTHVSETMERELEESQNAHKRYKEKISTLPIKNGWFSTHLGLYQYQGFWCYSYFLEGIMSAQEHFKAQSADIVVSSAPKSGTTWLKALTFAIVTRTRFDYCTNPLLTTMPHECIPFLEVDIIRNPMNRDPELPLLATHIPYTSLPESIVASQCKIVYICRNPKDAFVSLWHFLVKLTPKEESPLPLEEALELFCEGASYYGPYWDHVLGYWKASLEQPGRVLFLKYEDMKSETLFCVKKLAEFMGHPFSLEEERDGAVQKIIELCSFENLSNLEVNKSGVHRPDGPAVVSNSAYFRKGKVGDWKDNLTPEMTERLDQVTEQKLSGSGFTFHVSSN